MKKVCILTQSHLCRNPRVVKEANLLAHAGFGVIILTTFISEDLLSEDRSLISHPHIEYIGAVNIIPSQTKSLSRFYTRLLRKFAMELVDKFGLESPYALGYNYYKYFQTALHTNADLYIAHQEMPTYVGCKLLKLKRRVAFDLEDWYSVLLPETDRYRPVNLLRKLETTALKKGAFTFTTSDSMASEMAKAYQSPIPVTLYNTFSWSERNNLDKQVLDRKDQSKTSLLWFSQTIGPGRGLELLIDALGQVNMPVELHLRGNCSKAYQMRLQHLFPYGKGHELFFHNLVPNQQLLSRIAEHDIGLALEQQEPLGRDLTVTNKILQYLLAGVAIVASGTKGQLEVAAKASKSVFIFENGNAIELAERINFLLENKELLKKSKGAALDIAYSYFCWEKQEAKLLQEVEKCLLEEPVHI